MLVLARRRNEKIVFPHLGVTVEILNITGNSVRIGVQAPPDIKILRQEVIDRGVECPEPPTTASGRPLTYAMRTRLHTVGLALQLARVAGKVFCQLLLQARQGLGLGNRVMQALKGNPRSRYMQAIFSRGQKHIGRLPTPGFQGLHTRDALHD